MTTLADRDWRLVAGESHDGATNMALDEVAAATAADGGPRTVRIYRWEPSTLTLGYNQDPETIDWEYCDREGISVVRRQTGGGAIYHDAYGDVSYSIVAPADELPGDLSTCYEQLLEPVLAAFDAMGVPVDFADAERPAVHEPACYLRALDPAHDLVDAEGRKISGNAQYRTRDAVVQHGSLTFERAAGRHCGVFAGDVSTAAFRRRVTSIAATADLNRDEVVETLAAAFEDWCDPVEDGWTDEELDDAADLVAEKYDATDWTRSGESAP